MVAQRTWHSIFHTDFRADLRGFTVPTLIIHGTADQKRDPGPDRHAHREMVPDGVHKEYQGAAHGLFVTHTISSTPTCSPSSRANGKSRTWASASMAMPR